MKTFNEWQEMSRPAATIEQVEEWLKESAMSLRDFSRDPRWANNKDQLFQCADMIDKAYAMLNGITLKDRQIQY